MASRILRHALSRRPSVRCGSFDLCAERTGGGFARLRVQDEVVSASGAMPAGARNGSRRIVVCGDFNVAPNDEDIYDPALWHGAIMCSEGERAAFAIGSVGLADTLRIHHPETGFSVGGIIGCWRFQRIAVCASMRFSPGKNCQRVALKPESTGRCAREPNHPTTLRSGREFEL